MYLRISNLILYYINHVQVNDFTVILSTCVHIVCINNWDYVLVCVLYSTGGIAIYTVEARKRVRVFQSHSVISNPDKVKSGFFKVSISCVGNDSSAVIQWRGPDGSPISDNFHDPTYQRDGQLLVSRFDRQYSNGNYKCKIGDEEAVIGLYFTSGSLVGE